MSPKQWFVIEVENNFRTKIISKMLDKPEDAQVFYDMVVRNENCEYYICETVYG